MSVLTEIPTIDIIYNPFRGKVYQDGLIGIYCDLVEIMAKVEFDNKDEVFTIIIGSSLILDELRARMIEGRLKIRNVTYETKYMKSIEIPIDKDAQFTDYLPEGFCDYQEKALMRILYGKPTT